MNMGSALGGPMAAAGGRLGGMPVAPATAALPQPAAPGMTHPPDDSHTPLPPQLAAHIDERLRAAAAALLQRGATQEQLPQLLHHHRAKLEADMRRQLLMRNRGLLAAAEGSGAAAPGLASPAAPSIFSGLAGPGSGTGGSGSASPLPPGMSSASLMSGSAPGLAPAPMAAVPAGLPAAAGGTPPLGSAPHSHLGSASASTAPAGLGSRSTFVPPSGLMHGAAAGPLNERRGSSAGSSPQLTPASTPVPAKASQLLTTALAGLTSTTMPVGAGGQLGSEAARSSPLVSGSDNAANAAGPDAPALRARMQQLTEALTEHSKRRQMLVQLRQTYDSLPEEMKQRMSRQQIEADLVRLTTTMAALQTAYQQLQQDLARQVRIQMEDLLWKGWEREFNCKRLTTERSGKEYLLLTSHFVLFTRTADGRFNWCGTR